MGARRRLPLLLLLLLLVGPRAAAEPSGDELFRAHHARALDLYQARRYEEAIAALEAAYALRPDPRLLLNLGHACRRLGRTTDALGHYQRYREQMPNLSAAELAAVEEYMALARRSPEPVKEPAKEPAPEPAKEPAREPVKEPAVVAAPRPVVTLPAEALVVRPRTPAAPPLYRRWWFWGIVGVAAAGAVTAAVLSTQPWDANLPAGAPIHDPKF